MASISWKQILAAVAVFAVIAAAMIVFSDSKDAALQEFETVYNTRASVLKAPQIDPQKVSKYPSTEGVKVDLYSTVIIDCPDKGQCKHQVSMNMARPFDSKKVERVRLMVTTDSYKLLNDGAIDGVFRAAVGTVLGPDFDSTALLLLESIKKDPATGVNVKVNETEILAYDPVDRTGMVNGSKATPFDLKISAPKL